MQFQQSMALQMGISVVDAGPRIRELGYYDFHDWVGHLACTPKCVQFVQSLIETVERRASCTVPPPVMQAINYLGLLPKPRDIPNVTLELDDDAIPRIAMDKTNRSSRVILHTSSNSNGFVTTSGT